jgi:hypothetical protein
MFSANLTINYIFVYRILHNMINKSTPRIKISNLIISFFIFALTNVAGQESSHLIQPSGQDTFKPTTTLPGQRSEEHTSELQSR